MLIAGGDDYGASPSATDTVLKAFEEQVIFSASAMVWMRDSRRAAELARANGLPVGLHLNFTLPFDAPNVSASARHRQLELTRWFGRATWQQDTGERPPQQLLRDGVEDQIEQFSECFGEPTHLDGHHHVHVHEPVLDVLPRGQPIRPILRMPSRAGEQTSRRERRLHELFSAPRAAFLFEHLHPALGGIGFRALDHARGEAIEVITHPRQERQLQALTSTEWREVVSSLPVGSYAEL